jgi:glycosyltransferase involved in cell wall biosynthesis
MTVHDLSPWRTEWCEETSLRVRRRTPWLLKLGLAAMVVTPTEAVRREVIQRFKMDPDKVRAVPHGVDARFWSGAEVPSGPRPTLLTVATKGKRKNLETAIAAAKEAGVELWVAGRGEWPASTDLVKFLGCVDDEELASLYARATAFLFPSHYEGFGLPVLEAMACGTPVIASRDPALVEVAGGAALHCDADDTRAWVEAIRCVPLRREELARRGRARAAEFTWEKTAKLTRQVYEEALCHRGAR